MESIKDWGIEGLRDWGIDGFGPSKVCSALYGPEILSAWTTLSGRDLESIKDSCRNDIWEFETESAAKVHHVAPFPGSIVSKFIRLYTFPGEIVLDPFAGSGTVGLAASANKRKSIMIDIDTNFCEYMKDKFENRANLLNDE